MDISRTHCDDSYFLLLEQKEPLCAPRAMVKNKTNDVNVIFPAEWNLDFIKKQQGMKKSSKLK